MELVYIKNDPNWKKKRKSEVGIPCKYNEGCACISRDCWRCGWNPKVAKARAEKVDGLYGN